MNRRGSISVAAFVAAVTCALALPAAPAVAATGSIAGTVVEAEGNAPTDGVEVCAWAFGGGEATACVFTQGDGSYTVDGLDPGDYTVEFWPGEANPELAMQFWDGKSRREEADVVSLGDGEARTGVDVELPLGSTIAGSVFDAALGQPVPGIRVCSIDAVNDELWICARTNANGSYGLPFHATGDYKVVFSPEYREWDPTFPVEDDGYPTRFWNEADSLANAFVMSIGPAWFVGGIDVRYGTPPVAAPPALMPIDPPATPKPRRCKRGYRKKLVRGKKRCVKVRRHRHHRHKHRFPGTARRVFLR